MNIWLDEDLKIQIRKVFEPRYMRQLSDAEVVQIGENLANTIEIICKFKWKQIYEKPKKYQITT